MLNNFEIIKFHAKSSFIFLFTALIDLFLLLSAACFTMRMAELNEISQNWSFAIAVVATAVFHIYIKFRHKIKEIQNEPS